MPRERRSKYANDAKDTVGIASQVESLSSSLAQIPSQVKILNHARRVDFKLTDFPIKFDIYKNANGKFDAKINAFKLLARNSTTLLKNYYVSESRGNDTTGNGTFETPYARIVKVLDTHTDIDTIFLEEGIYDRPNMKLITKNIKIKAMPEQHVIISGGDKGTRFVWTEHVTGVYKTPAWSMIGVADLKYVEADGSYKIYTKVNSVDEVVSTVGSWFVDATDSNRLYVHCIDNRQPDRLLMPTANYFTFNSKDCAVYLEGIEFILGSGSVIQKTVSETLLVAKNCKFNNTVRGDGVKIHGANAIFIDCESNYNYDDGFSYHQNAAFKGYGVEINCVGHSNGLGNTSTINNGSTSHGDYRVIRLNGMYFNNRGINLADVQTTKVWNMNCVCFDATGQNIDCTIEGQGYLDSCQFSSQKAINNFGTVYTRDSVLVGTITSSGQIIEY
jgi:hypothetical protein